MIKKIVFSLLIITVLLLRLWQLDSIPPHLRNDEAALGVNAYTILKSGKDEHGYFFPILFQSFGDWKPGFYIYLTIPFISILGLNEWAVRLPSAIAGLITIFLTYLITHKISSSQKIAFFAAVLTAIAPWSIAFSRGAWEANVSLMLTLAGIYFFLKSFLKPPLLIISAIFFALTLLTYHGAKVSTPLILIALIFAFWKGLVKLNRGIIFISLVIVMFISFPVISSLFTEKSSRINSLSILNLSPDEYINSTLSQSGEEQSDITYFLFHNRWLVYFRSIFWRWSENFTLSTLFLRGDLNPQHTAPNTGPFILPDVLFLLAGLIKLIELRRSKPIKFIFGWFIFAPLPSSLTIESVNFVRTLPLFVPLTIIMAYGLDSLLTVFKKKISKKIFLFSVVIFTFSYLISYGYFIDQYFIHNPKKSGAWQYGYKQIIEKLNNLKSDYKNIYLDDGPDKPYIFFLFYNNKVANIRFIKGNETYQQGSLYVLPVSKISQLSMNYQVIDEINDLSGFPIFKMIEFK